MNGQPDHKTKLRHYANELWEKDWCIISHHDLIAAAKCIDYLEKQLAVERITTSIRKLKDGYTCEQSKDGTVTIKREPSNKAGKTHNNIELDTKKLADQFISDALSWNGGPLLPIPRTFIGRWYNAFLHCLYKKEKHRILKNPQLHKYLQIYHLWLDNHDITKAKANQRKGTRTG